MHKCNLQRLVLAEFAKQHYVAKADFDLLCRREKIRIAAETINRYFVEWRSKGLIFSAGRGWYSDLQDEFVLYTKPLTELNSFLKKEFPLLDFVCWSTCQLTSYYHNLPGKFHTFIYVDRYAMQEVAAALQKEYRASAVLAKPRKQEAANFSPKENNFIIRPIIYDDRKNAADPCLYIENILVDLAIEAEKLSLMDETEYAGILDNIATSRRIKPGIIARRMTRRKTKSGYADILRNYFNFEHKNPSMSTFLKR